MPDDGSPARLADHPFEDPLLRGRRPKLTQHFLFHGLLVRFETDDERLAGAAWRALGGAAGATNLEDREPEIVSRVLVHHVSEPPGWTPKAGLQRQQGPLHTFSIGRASTLVCDEERGFGFGFVSQEVLAHAELVRESIVLAPIYAMMRPHTICPVHAACLHKDGVTLLLRGDSGAGKSTMTYAALKRGFSIVAEDAPTVRTSPGWSGQAVKPLDVMVFGAPWRINLLPDAAELFPELGDIVPTERLSGEYKLEINIPERFPDQWMTSAPLGPIVFIERRSGRAPSVTRIDRSEALSRLRASALPYEEAEAARVALWDAMLALPVFVISTGDDPHEGAALLEQIVRAVATMDGARR